MNLPPAEQIIALQALIHRLDTGSWEDTADVDALNTAAAGLGANPAFRVLPQPGFYTTSQPFVPAFVQFEPWPFLGALDDRSLS